MRAFNTIQDVNSGELPKYNMAGLFAMGFGGMFIPRRYEMGEGEDANPAFDFTGFERVGADDITMGTSWLGTPIAFKFGLKGGTYKYYKGGELKERRVADFQMPLSTMVEVDRSKIDRITPMSGGMGSVKEMYAWEDWNVRISGYFLFDPDHPQASQPVEQRARLLEFEELADSVVLMEDSGLFTDLGIYRLYIRSIRLGQLLGRPNMLPFSLECLSDEPVQLAGVR
ncbi:MAG: DUF6046 domain-containing protein [Gammaproteobacteria bacterium]|nr:DUF6046 domain-containing protein [Gammaproteobacteria bacterium]